MRWTVVAIMLTALTACGTKGREIREEVDFFRSECAETQEQEACMRYQESLMKLAEYKANKRAAAGFLFRPVPKSTCQANSAGSVICY